MSNFGNFEILVRARRDAVRVLTEIWKTWIDGTAQARCQMTSYLPWTPPPAFFPTSCPRFLAENERDVLHMPTTSKTTPFLKKKKKKQALV